MLGRLHLLRCSGRRSTGTQPEVCMTTRITAIHANACAHPRRIGTSARTGSHGCRRRTRRERVCTPVRVFVSPRSASDRDNGLVPADGTVPADRVWSCAGLRGSVGDKHTAHPRRLHARQTAESAARVAGHVQTSPKARRRIKQAYLRFRQGERARHEKRCSPRARTR
jgi:hypothetical protein